MHGHNKEYSFTGFSPEEKTEFLKKKTIIERNKNDIFLKASSTPIEDRKKLDELFNNYYYWIDIENIELNNFSKTERLILKNAEDIIAYLKDRLSKYDHNKEQIPVESYKTNQIKKFLESSKRNTAFSAMSDSNLDNIYHNTMTLNNNRPVNNKYPLVIESEIIKEMFSRISNDEFEKTKIGKKYIHLIERIWYISLTEEKQKITDKMLFINTSHNQIKTPETARKTIQQEKPIMEKKSPIKIKFNGFTQSPEIEPSKEIVKDERRKDINKLDAIKELYKETYSEIERVISRIIELSKENNWDIKDSIERYVRGSVKFEEMFKVIGIDKEEWIQEYNKINFKDKL